MQDYFERRQLQQEEPKTVAGGIALGGAYDDSLSFVAEWFDKMAAINKPFRIIFYPVDNSIEITDMTTRKQHLKRIQFPGITQKDLFVGNTIDVYGRRFKITEFADKFTKENLVHNSEKTFVLIKPDCYIHVGKVIDFIVNGGQYAGQLKLNKVQMLKLNGKMVQ